VPFTSAQVSDLEEIRALGLRYCRGIDRLDAELVRSAYWPDATDDHGSFKGNAWEFAAYAVERLGAAYLTTQHAVTNHSIELDGDVAHGELYNVSTHLREDAQGVRHVDTWYGRYLDRYERRDGEWRIADRVCVHEWTRTDPVTAPMPIDAARFRQGSADRGT
jgi:hypothetical protein